MRSLLWLSAVAMFAASCGNDDATQRGSLGVLRVRVANPSADDIAFTAGIDDFIADANAHGGVGGHPIVYDEVELGSDPTLYAQTYSAAKAAHRGALLVSVFGVGRADTEALVPFVNPDLLAYVTRSDDPRVTAPAGVQSTVALPSGQTAPDGSDPFVVDVPPVSVSFHVGLDAGTAARIAVAEVDHENGRRLIFAVCATPARGCAAGVVAGKTAAADLGITVGEDIALPDDVAAIPAAVTAYLDAHPLTARDWIWAGDDAVSASAVSVTVAGYAVSHAIEPRVIVDAAAFDETFLARCGVACAERIRGIMPVKPFGDARSFLMTEVSSVYAAAHPGDASLANVRYVEGYTNAANWAAAVNYLAVPNLPIIPSILRSSLERSDDLEVGGLIEKKQFTLTDHRATSSAEIYGIDANGLFSFIDVVSVQLVPETLGY